MTIEIRSVPNTSLPHVWPEMLDYIHQLVENSRGTLSPGAIYDAVMERDMQAYVAVDERDKVVGVIITEVRMEPNGLRVFTIVGLAGDQFDRWIGEGDRLMRAFAQAHDIPVIEMIGRRGWARRLADMGWRESAVVMRLDLRN